ncbi:unnamed protein product [Phaeothamnion confervicola]
MGKSHRTNTNTAAQQRAISRLELVHSDIFGPLPVRSRPKAIAMPLSSWTIPQECAAFTSCAVQRRYSDASNNSSSMLKPRAVGPSDASEPIVDRYRAQSCFPCRMPGKRNRAGIFSAVYAVNERRGRTKLAIAHGASPLHAGGIWLTATFTLGRRGRMHALDTSVYLANRTPTKSLPGWTCPLHAWNRGAAPPLDKLRNFGCMHGCTPRWHMHGCACGATPIQDGQKASSTRGRRRAA